jgi:hypothetical protein
MITITLATNNGISLIELFEVSSKIGSFCKARKNTIVSSESTIEQLDDSYITPVTFSKACLEPLMTTEFFEALWSLAYGNIDSAWLDDFVTTWFRVSKHNIVTGIYVQHFLAKIPEYSERADLMLSELQKLQDETTNRLDRYQHKVANAHKICIYTQARVPNNCPAGILIIPPYSHPYCTI